jgi:sugar lactone lactonase YvrE
VAETGPADGIMFGRYGNLYLSHIADSAIRRLTPSGEVQTLIRDERVSWPDTFAVGPDGAVYFTTSKIHLGPNPPAPYRIWKLTPQ